jgi:hypothetical protein
MSKELVHKSGKVAVVTGLSALLLFVLDVPMGIGVQPDEILRYEVTWNGKRAGHGDITTTGELGRVKVVVQAVSDGVLNTVVEMWSRIQSTFAPRTFTPHKYVFHLKSNLSPTEVVDLSFDPKTGLVQVNKQKGDEVESHCEKRDSAYDPVTAAYLLRHQPDLSRAMYVDVYDGKARARLFVTPAGTEYLTVKGGLYPAIRLRLRLVRLTGNKEEIGAATLWISDDAFRIPLLLTSSPIVGTVRFELVQVQR